MKSEARPTRVMPSMAAFLSVQLICAAALSASSFAQSFNPTAPRKVEKTAPASSGHSMSDWHAAKLIGATLTDTLGNSIGIVQDIVIDRDGKVVAVLVSVGGVLGLGETTVPIALRHLTINSVDAEKLDVKTSLSREAIEQSAQIGSEAPPATTLEREAQ